MHGKEGSKRGRGWESERPQTVYYWHPSPLDTVKLRLNSGYGATPGAIRKTNA